MNVSTYNRWKNAARRLRLAEVPVLFFCFLLQGWSAETVSVTYTFADPDVVSISDSHVSVSIAGCDVSHAEGQPRLPFRTARIVLPPGTRIDAVAVEALAPVKIISLAKLIDFGRAPIPLGIDDPAARLRIQQTIPDPAIYGVDAPYPQRRAELLSVQRMHGIYL